MNSELAFEDFAPIERGASEPALIVDVDGFEGPLDLLLELARRQKVDMTRISILALAEQYLAFVEEARRTRLELAADYLVMAAWLAFLKARIVPPQAAAPGTVVALRLQRVEATREGGTKLFQGARLGADVFGRGDPQPIAEIKRPE